MAAYYDKYDYTLYWNGRDYEHASEAFALQAFFKKIGLTHSIADIGAGFGRLTPLYKDFAKELFLVEPSGVLLKKAKVRHSKLKKKMHFIQSNVEELPKKLAKVDALLMIRVMHHIVDADIAFKNISKVIKPGGFLILEFANKLHGKAQFEEIKKGNLLYPFDIFPSDRRSRASKEKKTISFFNYHPDSINQLLRKNGFTILETRSVSNIRSSRIKKHIPGKVLLWGEKLLQRPLATFHFGPSIFLLAYKQPS